MDTLIEFLDSPAGIAVKAAIAAAFLDLITGVMAAAKDGTFAWDAIAAYLRKHLLGRVGPLAALLGTAYVSGDELLMGFAIIGLTTYAAETIASVKSNLFPPSESAVKEASPAADINPIPQD